MNLLIKTYDYDKIMIFCKPEFREPEKPAVSAETPGGGGGIDSDSDSDLDLDISVDIMALSGDARKEINKVGKGYELGREDFIKYLARDIEEQEEARAARQQGCPYSGGVVRMIDVQHNFEKLKGGRFKKLFERFFLFFMN